LCRLRHLVARSSMSACRGNTLLQLVLLRASWCSDLHRQSTVGFPSAFWGPTGGAEERGACDAEAGPDNVPAASRSLATTSSGRGFFRRLVVIESLLALRAIDLHIYWIRISEAGRSWEGSSQAAN
jgi:hypothetical protein